MVDLKTILNVFEILGIHEDIPQSTKILNFDLLDGRCIRILNRLIVFMDKKNIDDVKKLLPPEDIERLQIISKNREYEIEAISIKNFRDLLVKLKIINHGEELNDSLVEFLELSPDHDHLILLKKLQKGLKLVNFSSKFHNL